MERGFAATRDAAKAAATARHASMVATAKLAEQEAVAATRRQLRQMAASGPAGGGVGRGGPGSTTGASSTTASALTLRPQAGGGPASTSTALTSLGASSSVASVPGAPKYRIDPDAVHRTGSLRDLFEICRRPGCKKSLAQFLETSPFLARRPIRYGKRFSGGIGFQTCYYPGRYYYGSKGYPDVSPYAVHIVAANADDVDMMDVLARFGASLAAKDLGGRSVFDVCRSEVMRVYVKRWHAEHGLHISGRPITPPRE